MQTLPQNLRKLIQENRTEVGRALLALRDPNCPEVTIITREGKYVTIRPLFPPAR